MKIKNEMESGVKVKRKKEPKPPCQHVNRLTGNGALKCLKCGEVQQPWN